MKVFGDYLKLEGAAWWSALLFHTKVVQALNPHTNWASSVWSFYILPSFLQQPRDMHARLTGESKLAVGVTMSMSPPASLSWINWSKCLHGSLYFTRVYLYQLVTTVAWRSFISNYCRVIAVQLIINKHLVTVEQKNSLWTLVNDRRWQKKSLHFSL